MNTGALLSELRRLDIRFRVEGDELRCDAPAGVLTDGLREQLRQRKHDILRFLRLAQDLAAQRNALVPLQQNGSKPPIFAVPGHSGDVFCYRALAQALGPEQPFYGLQPPGTDDAAAPLTRVEDLAAYFAEQIRALWPHGPWIIAGYCAGGTVAFELARQLYAGHESSGLLALFGAPPPAAFRPLERRWQRLKWRVQGMSRRVRLLAHQSTRERLEYVAWRVRLMKKPPADAVALARARLEKVTIDAVAGYEPAPFLGRVLQFVPSEAWVRQRGAARWRALAPRLETYAGPEGCAADEMLYPQYAAVFARQLRRSCAELRTSVR